MQWWSSLSILPRLLLLVSAVMAVGASAVFYFMVQKDIAEAKTRHRLYMEEMLEFMPATLAQATTDRNFTMIKLLLDSQVKKRDDVERIEWTFAGGVTLITTKEHLKREAPAWFSQLLKLPHLTKTENVKLDGPQYGKITIVITPEPAIDWIWSRVVYLFKALLLVVSSVFVTIAFLLRANLKVIHDLKLSTSRFSEGDLTIRIKVRGARDFRSLAISFNAMADQIGSLLNDLTSKRNALEKQLKFTSLLLETIPSPVYYQDVNGKLLGANKAWRNLVNISPNAPLEKTIAEYYRFDSAFAQRNIDMDNAVFQRAMPLTMEDSFTDNNQRQRHLLFSKAAFESQSNTLGGVITTITDLTAIKLAQEAANSANIAKVKAETVTETRSRFFANISHEFRTPLSAILGYAELLEDDDQSPQDKTKSVAVIISSANHLLQLINDLLDITKLEANKLQVEKHEVDPILIAESVREFTQLNAERRGIEFTIEYNGQLPHYISTDPLRLKQILLNLCSNAIKFTHKGFVRLAIQVDESTSSVQFLVVDTGIGMTKAQIDNLFTAFTQAESSTARKYGGTGLGLYLSKNLAELLGGTLTVASEKDKGSCFTLTLPASQSNQTVTNVESPSTVSTLAEPNASSPTFEGHILIAEDDETNHMILAWILEKCAVKLARARDGQEVITLATQHRYDLVLMDLNMPVMNGIETTRRLREIGYSQPIVVLTASIDDEDKTQCIAAGCNSFLTKPYNKKELFMTLGQYLPAA